MAEEEGQLKDYELTIRDEETGEAKIKTCSRGYVGFGLAKYPNGDQYEGEVGGVEGTEGTRNG